MLSSLSIAVLAGLGGMLGWGLADFFAKKTIDELGDVMTLAWAGVFGSLAFALAAAYDVLIQGASFYIPQAFSTWLMLAFMGALQGAVYIFAYRGFAKGQVGLLSPVFASFSAIVALISILFLGEATSGGRITALVLTFIGILILNADLSAVRSFKVGVVSIAGLRDVTIAAALAAVWTILWERFVSGSDWLFYAFYMFLFMTLAVFVFAYTQRLPFRVRRPGLWKSLLAIGACETLAYIAITLGYGMTPFVSVVAILSGAFSLPTIVLARLFLKEHITRAQLTGAVVILLGTALLAVV